MTWGKRCIRSQSRINVLKTCIRPAVDYVGKLPWTRRRGPVYWEERLTAHYATLGVVVSEAYLKMWWRAQAVAYLVRINAPTLAAVRALRIDPRLHQVRRRAEAVYIISSGSLW